MNGWKEEGDQEKVKEAERERSSMSFVIIWKKISQKKTKLYNVKTLKPFKNIET